MIPRDVSVFDGELDFLVRDIIDSPIYEDGLARLADAARILDEYSSEDINSFLRLYLPANAERFSNLEIYEGIDKLSRYLEVLWEELKKLEKTHISPYNQII